MIHHLHFLLICNFPLFTDQTIHLLSLPISACRGAIGDRPITVMTMDTCRVYKTIIGFKGPSVMHAELNYY